MINHLKKIGEHCLTEAGQMAIFLWETFKWLPKRPYRFRILLEQMEFVGNKSLFIVTLTSIFSGMVFALQIYYGFKIINSETLVGASVALALSREIGPVLTSLLVAGRAGAAIAAQLGTMRVTEQIDALEVMAVSPKQFLVLPRILASIIMLPLLTGVFVLIGNIGAYFVGVLLLDIDGAVYMDKLVWYVQPSDIMEGLFKSSIFGLIIAWVATYKGFFTTKGAQGVGKATNESVVWASVMILIADYFITAFIPRNGS